MASYAAAATAPPHMTAAGMNQPPLTGNTYAMASLYVGDLHPSVDEATLFSKFSAAGPVISIRVCRDMLTRRSLGYAYVNFQQPADAERVLDILNFDIIFGQPIRIMWSQRDPSIRRSGIGNIFIKNLSKDIDTKALHDTFSVFGNILSCKIMLNNEGRSRGFGFVHFEREESAQCAINQVNGMILNKKKVYVGPFKSKAVRQQELGDNANKFNNIFIKNFGTVVKDDKKLREMFERFGEIISARVFVDDQGNSKGFGFVCFKNPDHAEQAVLAMNGTTVGDRSIYVGRAQARSERQAELARRLEALRVERASRFKGVNLYVKNLDDDIDDDRLRTEFTQFGELASVKVMTENGRSKGFGFVCFNNPEDATKAITIMNGRTLGSKPLYVALAQRREERKQLLASLMSQRLLASRNAPLAPGMIQSSIHPSAAVMDEAAAAAAAGAATAIPYGAFQAQQAGGYPVGGIMHQRQHIPAGMSAQFGSGTGSPMQILTSNVQQINPSALTIVQPSSMPSNRIYQGFHQAAATPAVSSIFSQTLNTHLAMAHQQQQSASNREYHQQMGSLSRQQVQQQQQPHAQLFTAAAAANGGRIYNNPAVAAAQPVFVGAGNVLPSTAGQANIGASQAPQAVRPNVHVSGQGQMAGGSSM